MEQYTTHSERTAYEIVKLSRHPERPHFQDLLETVFQDPIELHGDRIGTDDRAVWTGLAYIEQTPIVLVGQKKGRTPEEQKNCQYGMMSPGGYRKARRMFTLAQKFRKPLITIIDTPGAYPGIEAEAELQALAIAENLKNMSQLSIPSIAIVLGEGGSGGALGIGVCQKILMLENSYYSVISPEGCASILWKDRHHAPEAAEQLKLRAKDAYQLGFIHGIIPEPEGGAHLNWDITFSNIKHHILNTLHSLLNKETVHAK